MTNKMLMSIIVDQDRKIFSEELGDENRKIWDGELANIKRLLLRIKRKMKEFPHFVKVEYSKKDLPFSQFIMSVHQGFFLVVITMKCDVNDVCVAPLNFLKELRVDYETKKSLEKPGDDAISYFLKLRLKSWNRVKGKISSLEKIDYFSIRADHYTSKIDSLDHFRSPVTTPGKMTESPSDTRSIFKKITNFGPSQMSANISGNPSQFSAQSLEVSGIFFSNLWDAKMKIDQQCERFYSKPVRAWSVYEVCEFLSFFEYNGKNLLEYSYIDKFFAESEIHGAKLMKSINKTIIAGIKNLDSAKKCKDVDAVCRILLRELDELKTVDQILYLRQKDMVMEMKKVEQQIQKITIKKIHLEAQCRIFTEEEWLKKVGKSKQKFDANEPKIDEKTKQIGFNLRDLINTEVKYIKNMKSGIKMLYEIQMEMKNPTPVIRLKTALECVLDSNFKFIWMIFSVLDRIDGSIFQHSSQVHILQCIYKFFLNQNFAPYEVYVEEYDSFLKVAMKKNVELDRILHEKRYNAKLLLQLIGWPTLRITKYPMLVKKVLEIGDFEEDLSQSLRLICDYFAYELNKRNKTYHSKVSIGNHLKKVYDYDFGTLEKIEREKNGDRSVKLLIDEFFFGLKIFTAKRGVTERVFDFVVLDSYLIIGDRRLDNRGSIRIINLSGNVKVSFFVINSLLILKVKEVNGEFKTVMIVVEDEHKEKLKRLNNPYFDVFFEPLEQEMYWE